MFGSYRAYSILDTEPAPPASEGHSSTGYPLQAPSADAFPTDSKPLLKFTFTITFAVIYIPFMSIRTPKFVSRTSEDFTSQLTRRNAHPHDEESNLPSPATRWLGAGKANDNVPKMVRGITIADEEKIHVGKVKKLGTFSGVCIHRAPVG